MAKVAHLYYIGGLKQAQIADQLDISQASISRLLKKAEAEQIVRISVSLPLGVYAELENQLETLYGLKEAIIVDAIGAGEEGLLQALGAAAAYYLETTISAGEVVGISSWSTTLLAMVDAMRQSKRPLAAQVVQILGGIGSPSAEVYASRLTDRLAKLLGGNATFLPAPGVAVSAEARGAFLNDLFVQEAYNLFDKVTLALVGIGEIRPSKLLASSGNVFAPQELDLLRERGAVGDICLRFFDQDGQAILNTLDDRVIGMSLEQLKNVRRCVGIAGGAHKAAAIQGALAGGWINVLITDQASAQALITAKANPDENLGEKDLDKGHD